MPTIQAGAVVSVFCPVGGSVTVTPSAQARVAVDDRELGGSVSRVISAAETFTTDAGGRLLIEAIGNSVTYSDPPIGTAAQASSVQALVSDDGIAAPSTNLSAAVGSAGVLTGAYYYTQTFVTALGETAPWPGTATVVNPSSQQVNLTSIPVGPEGVIARRIYRTPATPVDPKDYRFVAEIGNNTATTYTDNLADGSLGAPVRWNATNRGRFRNAAGAEFAEFSDQSTALGQGTFSVNTGYASTAIGFEALKANTTGRRNVALGTYSLTALTTGFENTSVGVHAGNNATAITRNTLVGFNAGFNLTTQNGNTFIGHNSGLNAGQGAGAATDNIALGRGALTGTASGIGTDNLALGRLALGDINTADQCIGIGPMAGRYANASRMLFIDPNATARANLAAGQDSGLIYGKAESTAQTQVLHLNAATRLGWAAATVSQLPAASTALRGFRASVTDASVAYTSANVGSTVAGGGSNTVPVFCNGTNWVIG